MSSKAAKRRAEFEKRETKRKKEAAKMLALRNATTIEEAAKALGINLK